MRQLGIAQCGPAVNANSEVNECLMADFTLTDLPNPLVVG